MHKYQLKKGYRDGSVAPQDFSNRKVFIGSVIHEYAEPTEFIEMMLEGGYIEEVIDEPVDADIKAFMAQATERKKRKGPKVIGELTTD